MTSLTESAKEASAPPPPTDKIIDLQRDIHVPQPCEGLTTDYGIKVSDTDNWLKVISCDGKVNGPMLLEDQIGREKVQRFDHERIPERVVHARGTAAHGYFKVTTDVAKKYTFAPVLTDSSRTTPVFVRFSTVQGPRGSSDTVRDIRGFATKFYTKEGNWDLVGNDIPVFFIQDAIKFPDFIHSVKPEPHNEVPTGQSAHNNFWDFARLRTEATHTVMWVMSDRGIPRSLRMMQGFGVNTYTLVRYNAEQKKHERYFVKFHFIPTLGVFSLVWDEALKIAGQDPDFHRKDLNEAIENGACPKWKLYVQAIPESEEFDPKFKDFDILDATKVWPEELVPLEEIGEMVLDRVVDEFFPETEQVAFCTSHIIPGIGFSDDPLLQGRNFSYFDTQISRLGINFEELPINRPICPVFNHNRDGKARHRITTGPINYYPNRKNIGIPVPEDKGGYVEYAERINGIKKRALGEKFQEHFKQAQVFYYNLTEYEQNHLKDAVSFELSHCDDPVVYKLYIDVLNKVNNDLAKYVARKVGADPPSEPSPPYDETKRKGLSQTKYIPYPPTIVSRRIAILIADGFNVVETRIVKGILKAYGAFNYIVGPRRGYIRPMEGQDAVPDDYAVHSFESQRSTLFDAIYIPSGSDCAKALTNDGRVVHWVRETFGHCKPIAAVGEAVDFLRNVVQLPKEVELYPPGQHDDKVVSSYAVVTTGRVPSGPIPHPLPTLEKGSKSFAGEFGYQISQHRCYQREIDGLTWKVAF